VVADRACGYFLTPGHGVQNETLDVTIDNTTLAGLLAVRRRRRG